MGLVVTIVPIIFSLISIVVSIVTVRITIKNSYQNELILRPRFSLEKNINESKTESFIWKISNLGGAISNATIYPMMYVTFSIFDEDKDEDIDIVLELIDYYGDNNYYYSNSDGTFYIKDDRHFELEEFIERYSNKIEYLGYSIMPYFTIHYKDYKGNICNEVYTIVDDEFFENDSEHKVYGETMKKLKEVSEIPNSDIITLLKFDTKCVVSVNYENAMTQQIIDDEDKYNDYLYSVIMDLFDSKSKPIEEMYGQAILSNGTLWVRDIDTGELTWIADDVEDFGFTE